MVILAAAPPSTAGTSAVQVWTLVVAGVAVLATLISAYLLRRTGKGTIDAAKQAAAAAAIAADAAQRAAASQEASVAQQRALQEEMIEFQLAQTERAEERDRESNLGGALVKLIEILISPPRFPERSFLVSELDAYADDLRRWNESINKAMARSWRGARPLQMEILIGSRHELVSLTA